MLNAMEHPTPQQALSERIKDFTISIKLLLDARHTTPALIVMYAAIDIFGSLLRSETEIDTVGKAAGYFKKWVNDYILGHSQLTCTAEELWGARCGLLHTHTASSKVSRRGTARQLHYSRGPLPANTQQGIRSVSAKGKLFVDVDVLYAAFEDGTRRFLTDIARDPQLEKRVLHHSSQLFGSWRYVA
jgi:hypothetical protein